MTLEALFKLIGSAASLVGRLRSELPDGPKTSPVGPEAAHVSRLAQPVSKKETPTSGISGPSSTDSSENANLRLFSESKSVPLESSGERLPKVRTCKKCWTEQPSSEFYVNSKGNYRTRCKTCERKAELIRKRKDPEGYRKKYSSWRDKKRGHALVNVAKFRAKIRGIPFDLDPEEIDARIKAGHCELTGIAFDLKTPRSWNAPSLDQIEPGKGYTKQNVRVVLYAVNVMANVWGANRILEIAQAITSRRIMRSNDLSRAIAERLKVRTNELGSTLFELTWKEHVTPSGHVLPRLVASERRTEDTVCIGWPTPQLSDTSGGGQAKRSDGRANLNDFAMLSGWPTSRATEGEKNVRSPEGAAREMERKGGPQDLMQAAALTAWGTPAARDWKSGDASQETMDRNARPLNELAMLAGWTTLQAHDETGRSKGQKEIHGTLRGCACLVSEARLTAFGSGPIGFLLGPNGWEIVPACGQLNPNHSRWLMGFPASWCAAAVTAFRSLRGRKRER